MNWEYIVIAIILIIVLLVVLKTGKKDINLELNKLVEYLGGKDNIKNVLVDNARLKIEVNNLDNIAADKLHEKSPSGVFITGNYIKLLFKYDSQLIKREIERVTRG